MNRTQAAQDTVQGAHEAIRAAVALAAADPRRPRFHFHAPAQWMNDPNGPVFHRGWYHLFYQANPFAELSWGAEHARVCWGHARSRDLLHWEHLPIAIWPSLERGEEHCWSGGCVVSADGRPMIFYTSIGPTHPSKDGAEQWAAVGDEDLLTWSKHPANPIVAGKLFGATRVLEWRDPFVFRDGGTWYMATGGHREGGRGCLSVFRSPDLEHWAFAGIAIEGEEENWECPALFRLGDRWALIYSPHGPARYYTGRMDSAACRFEAQVHGQFDYGRFVNLYAPTVMALPDQRTILWAWMFSQHKGRGWNGCLALAREISLLPDGRIAQRPAREIESLRRDARRDAGVVGEGSPRRYATPGGCAEALLSVGAVRGAGFGVRLLGHAGVVGEVAWTQDGLVAMQDTVPPSELGARPPRELRLFVDRALVEVFIDGRLSVSRWIEADGVEAIELFAAGGEVEFESIRVWRIEETP